MSNLILPPSMQMTDKTSIGPVALGDMFPWRGLVFQVSKILGNDHNDFMLVLVPVAPTRGYIKRAQGKKGKKEAKYAKRYGKVRA